MKQQHARFTAATAQPVSLTQPHVCILLAVYNGARWLPDQLDSLQAQDHQNWQLLTSDDGSTDGSSALINRFASEQGAVHNITQLQGPRRGSGQNFLTLLRAAKTHMPPGSWLAFADQDDVWFSDRLSRGLGALRHIPDDQPALYCSATSVVNAALDDPRPSRRYCRPPSFLNALTQNIASGNTILLNPAAAQILMRAAQEVEEIVFHDWWAYQLITGAGGQVIYDPQATLLYRQHDSNVIGANLGWRAKLKRLRLLLQGDARRWNRRNLRALAASAHRLTRDNQATLAHYARLHSAGFLTRLHILWHLRPYRQSVRGTLIFWCAALSARL